MTARGATLYGMDVATFIILLLETTWFKNRLMVSDYRRLSKHQEYVSDHVRIVK